MLKFSTIDLYPQYFDVGIHCFGPTQSPHIWLKWPNMPPAAHASVIWSSCPSVTDTFSLLVGWGFSRRGWWCGAGSGEGSLSRPSLSHWHWHRPTQKISFLSLPLRCTYYKNPFCSKSRHCRKQKRAGTVQLLLCSPHLINETCSLFKRKGQCCVFGLFLSWNKKT